MADEGVLEQLASQLECEHSLKDLHGSPRIVAAPRSVSDVASCVRAAGSLGCSVSVVGGNHSGYGELGDLVLEMEHHFNAIVADNAAGRVRAEAGVNLKSLAAKTAEAELVVPLGTAPTVGVGLILQGGVGHLTRRAGLSLDAIHSVQLVTATGDVLSLGRDSSDEEHKDLFWALCGCGPNFGVVTSFELNASKLQSCRQTRQVFHVPSDRTACEVAPAVRAYMMRAQSLPRDCCSDCCLYIADDPAEPGMRVGIYDFNFGCDVPPVDAAGAKLLVEQVDDGLGPIQLMENEPSQCDLQPVQFLDIDCHLFFPIVLNYVKACRHR